MRFKSSDPAFPGPPGSELDIADLANELAHGRTVAETASFLCRDEDEVREKMKELGLVETARPRRPLGADSKQCCSDGGRAYMEHLHPTVGAGVHVVIGIPLFSVVQRSDGAGHENSEPSLVAAYVERAKRWLGRLERAALKTRKGGVASKNK